MGDDAKLETQFEAAQEATEAESVEGTQAEETDEEPSPQQQPEPASETDGAAQGDGEPVAAEVRSSEEPEAQAEDSKES